MTAHSVSSAPAGKSALQRRRLLRLTAVLLVLLLLFGALQIYRAYFSAPAREARLQKMDLAALEAESRRRGSDPAVFYHLARRRTEAGDLQGAEEALRWALRQEPGNARIRAALGSLLTSQEKYEEAVLQFRQAASDNPMEADVYLGLALLYNRHEAWRKMADTARLATEADPENPAGWGLLGDAHSHLKDHKKAAEFYEQAASLDPDNAQISAQAAFERILLGDLDAAEKYARQAIRAAPRSPIGHSALGQVLLRRGGSHIEEAGEAYRKAASLGAPGGAVQFGLGQVLLRQGRPVEAESHFRLALRADRLLNQARYGLLQALEQQGRRAEAERYRAELESWNRFDRQRIRLHDRVVAEPEKAHLWFDLAELHAEKDLLESAVRFTRSGLRRDPGSTRGHRLLERLQNQAAKLSGTAGPP